MSVLIKGIEMPKGNSTLNVLIYSDGRIFTGHKNDDEYSAVEIPTPHERLIDAGKLAKEILRAWNLWERKGEDCYLFEDVLTPMLISQPTIIEREE